MPPPAAQPTPRGLAPAFLVAVAVAGLPATTPAGSFSLDTLALQPFVTSHGARYTLSSTWVSPATAQSPDRRWTLAAGSPGETAVAGSGNGQPVLAVSVAGTEIHVAWIAGPPGVLLESSPALAGPDTRWTPVVQLPRPSGDLLTVRLPLGAGNRFFRLRGP